MPFSKATLTAVNHPFAIINDAVNVNYRGELEKDIAWSSETAIHLELQEASGIACEPQASLAALKNTFRLSERGSNKEGRVRINLAYFNDHDRDRDGSGDGISHENRVAIEQAFRNGGRLYIRLGQKGGGNGLALYVQLLGE